MKGEFPNTAMNDLTFDPFPFNDPQIIFKALNLCVSAEMTYFDFAQLRSSCKMVQKMKAL